MKHVLAAANREVLAQFAWSRVLLAFDFDGTLAPIVTDRDAARMRERTRALLAEVCELYPCAIISGRGLTDVSSRVGGLRVPFVVGNHGMEPGKGLPEFAREVRAIRSQLEAELSAFTGVDIEDKQFSLAVHYRRSRHKRAARAAIHAAVPRLLHPVREVAGKLVVNLIPEGAPHKGDALVRLRSRARTDTAIYVGDDVTDEDVFALDQPGRLLSIRVGCSRRSSAEYFLRDQREVDVLLRRLATLRRGVRRG
ncbi:MAG: trehalose-phosphatase [Deltaproteobacteria bacterium]|nr:trehalose-phosphatase [Deltaproteobacteria bacterium]